MAMQSNFAAKLLVSSTKQDVPRFLHQEIITACASSIASHGCFTIALSGGSLPNFLSSLPESFRVSGVDPMFDKWHVFLADERVVPSTHDDSNLKAIRASFLDKIRDQEDLELIPESQIYGIDYDKLASCPAGNSENVTKEESSVDEEIARLYQTQSVEPALAKSNGRFDCLLLGFGPDGHTCSLFPNHPLLNERTKLVAHISDSPKLPPRRITLTLPVLENALCVILVGAGSSKSPILKACFETLNEEVTAGKDMNGKSYDVIMKDPPPYPCAMARPKEGKLIWVVDADAAKDLEAAITL
mmetsp:Transcript_25042/g.36790  ORF Transcript_25042/g.36790 Transcript_25042/m.36790 type:complete len:301 (+) Transcript_25042:130-1032(+)|eukprot:CAMPEP_0195512058 /NCGR_PEP_ID=MMETSP0794_2-20130614/4159_1 /TAXON_ID=515487 /ORGANISM="Stephanopyxis turris, Strain CCMP 815" /LENGTH=300 /DNA_ID=CAMNT_0040639777 /DNA_START=100 /DNA_END=1002 /DNA_ORIENTATION=+